MTDTTTNTDLWHQNMWQQNIEKITLPLTISYPVGPPQAPTYPVVSDVMLTEDGLLVELTGGLKSRIPAALFKRLSALLTMAELAGLVGADEEATR